VATTDSSLGSPDPQVFMTTNETSEPSGTQTGRFLEDFSVDELSANAPADETSDDRNARRERNKKHNERHRRLRDSLPIWNLTEALNQVESRVHTTSEQCLMSITMIAHQAQGLRAGEVIAKLAEDAVDAKCAPSARHTASRTSWLYTRKESRDLPVNFS
jgi:hypothetical protein